MSYSFEAVGASRAAAIEMVEAKMKAVVEEHPVHAGEERAVIDAVAAFAGLLTDSDKQIAISVHGSVFLSSGVRSVSFGVTVAYK